MRLNTRAKTREAVKAVAEYAINEATEKTIKLNIPQGSIKSEVGEAVFVKSSLLDISVSGCAIDSLYIIPPGVILDIKIDPAPFRKETGLEHKNPIIVTGSVRSCIMLTPGHYRLGIQFIKIGKEDVDLIASFVKIKERRKATRWDMTQ